MECLRCGYEMTAFDRECPRCANMQAQVEGDAAPGDVDIDLLPSTPPPPPELAPRPPVPPPTCAPTPNYRPEGSSGLAVAAMILGIVSFPLGPVGLITGPLAIILGSVSLSRRQPGGPMAIVGVVLGCVAFLVSLVVGPIVAAILFPVFARARAKAQQNSCLSNVKQLNLGMLMYASDYDDRWPYAGNWPDAILPYINNTQIYACPSDGRTDGRSNKQTSGCSESVSYTMSPAFNGFYAGFPYPPGTLPPGETGVLFDGTQLGGGRDVAAYRHNGGLNVGYADGHVKWVGKKHFGEIALSPWQASVSSQVAPATTP